MGFLIGGAVVAIVGVILWMVMGKKAGQSAHLDLTDTSTVSEVKENYDSISGSMGSGNFTHFCELKGQAHSDQPLTAEQSNESVVYYKSEVIHKYERLENKKDSQGNMQKKWVKKTDTVSENEVWADGFGVKDATGFIAINPKKSKLDTMQLHSKFEKGEPNQSGLNIKLGGVSIGLGGGGNSNHRTIGYEYKEIGIKLGQNLYVLGDANDRDGSLIMSKPTDKKYPFIVSTKSEDELQAGLGSAIKGYKIGAFVCFGLGGALAVVGLLKMMSVF
jgi:E3 Ubiquitin ligase